LRCAYPAQPSRLSESKQLAIEVLEIKENLDPVATKIWKTYDLLAKIATAQGEKPQAKKYRQLAKSTKLNKSRKSSLPCSHFWPGVIAKLWKLFDPHS
jgi:hypothetical protein